MVLNAFDLTGKVAIVTGCDTGLGQGMTLGLAQAGCDIVGVNRRIPHETAEKVQALGRRFTAIQADLSRQDEIETIVDRAVAAMGRVDILVNNAGTIRRADALSFSEKDWDEVINLNLKSVFFLSQAVARQFIQQGDGGKIVNIASMLSFQGGIRVPSYTASKSGVLGITRLMANEWAGIASTLTPLPRDTWPPTIPSSCVKTPSAAKRFSIVFRPGAGACRMTFRGRSFFSPPGRRITLAALRWR